MSCRICTTKTTAVLGVCCKTCARDTAGVVIFSAVSILLGQWLLPLVISGAYWLFAVLATLVPSALYLLRDVVVALPSGLASALYRAGYLVCKAVYYAGLGVGYLGWGIGWLAYTLVYYAGLGVGYLGWGTGWVIYKAVYYLGVGVVGLGCGVRWLVYKLLALLATIFSSAFWAVGWLVKNIFLCITTSARGLAWGAGRTAVGLKQLAVAAPWKLYVAARWVGYLAVCFCVGVAFLLLVYFSAAALYAISRRAWNAASPALVRAKRRLRKCRATLAASSSPRQGHESAAEPKTMRRCGICMDDHAQQEMLCAGMAAPAGSSSSTAQNSLCGHYYCTTCMHQYASSEVAARKYPVVCPEHGCAKVLDHGNLVALLKDSPDDLRALQELETVHALGTGKFIYCPHKSCSTLLEYEAGSLQPNEPAKCPICERGFCAACRIPGWHVGFTCKDFQALPPHQRSAEDAALLQLSANNGWHPCPACHMLVEKSVGCNHMRCRCGADFCYKCGKKYRSKTPTAGNVHGTPGCNCRLFDVPRER